MSQTNYFGTEPLSDNEKRREIEEELKSQPYWSKLAFFQQQQLIEQIMNEGVSSSARIKNEQYFMSANDIAKEENSFYEADDTSKDIYDNKLNKTELTDYEIDLVNSYNDQLNEFNAAKENFNDTSAIVQSYNNKTNDMINEIGTEYISGLVSSIPGVSQVVLAKDIFEILTDQKDGKELWSEFPERLINKLADKSVEDYAHYVFDYSAPLFIAAGQLGAEQIKLLTNSLIIKNNLWDAEAQIANINSASELMKEEAEKLVEIRNQIEKKGIEVNDDYIELVEEPVETLNTTKINASNEELANKKKANSLQEVQAIISARKKEEERKKKEEEKKKKEKEEALKRKAKAIADRNRRIAEAAMKSVPAGSSTGKSVKFRTRV